MIVERRRLPSSSYHSPEDGWTKDHFAEQPIAVHTKQHDTAHVARHVADRQHSDQPFFVMNVPSVLKSLQDWTTSLPRVQPHYALRCNSDPVLAQLLADCPRMGFEVSNTHELRLACELVDTSRIVYSNPLWTRKSMRMAGESGVGTVVVGNEKEMLDVVSYAPCARVLLAVSLGCPAREESLGTATGCDYDEAVELLSTASDLRANFAGFSFNVDNSDPGVYYKALREVRRLYDVALSFGLSPDTISVGGGFRSPSSPGEKSQFYDVCDSLVGAVDLIFPVRNFPHLHWIASPGRFFATAAFALCTNVVAKRPVEIEMIDDYEESSNSMGFVYQTNEGIYGSFSCRLADCDPQCRPLKEVSSEESIHLGTVVGPSLDGIDVAQRVYRGRQLFVGEWLLWENMGAYSMPMDTHYPSLPVYYYAGKDVWECIINKSDETMVLSEDSDCDAASDGASDSDSVSSDDYNDLITRFDNFFEI